MMRVEVPGLRLPNMSNVRMHWREKAKLVKAQREAVTYALLGVDWSGIARPTIESPWLITLTRIGPRELDDDGLVTSCKGTRDAIAAFVGVDDRLRSIVKYEYQGAKGPFGVVIEITTRQGLLEVVR